MTVPTNKLKFDPYQINLLSLVALLLLVKDNHAWSMQQCVTIFALDSAKIMVNVSKLRGGIKRAYLYQQRLSSKISICIW